MLKFEDLVGADDEHPVLARWRVFAAEAGVTPAVEAVRPRLSLGHAPAHLKFSLVGHRRPQPELLPWDSALALKTAEAGWKGPRVSVETTRIALLLKSFLEPTVNRFGDGFFSSVLIDTIKTSEARSDPNVVELLRFIATNTPRRGAPYVACKDEVVAALARIAKLLQKRLKYTSSVSQVIWLASIAYYLDDRFSITDGRTLGLYQQG